MIKLLVMRRIWFLYSDCPHLHTRSHLSETRDNLWLLREPICGWNKVEEDVPHSFTLLSSFFVFPFSLFSGLVTIDLENFENYWDVQSSMFLLVCLILLNVLYILGEVKHLWKNTTQRSTWRVDSCECQAVWDSTVTYLGKAPFQEDRYHPGKWINVDRSILYLKKLAVLEVIGGNPHKKCPGYSWDRVNFFSSSWCNAVFWIKDENKLITHWCFSCC